MLYLFWAILNIGLFLYFMYICINAAKIVAVRFGIFAAIVFVLGILGLNCNSGKNHSTNNKIRTWQINKDSGIVNRSSTSDITIDENLMYKINLTVLYGYYANSPPHIPIEAHTGVNGTFIGTEWETQYISIYPTANLNIFKYEVNGLTEWKLFNAVIVSNAKTYTVFFDLK